MTIEDVMRSHIETMRGIHNRDRQQVYHHGQLLTHGIYLGSLGKDPSGTLRQKTIDLLNEGLVRGPIADEVSRSA